MLLNTQKQQGSNKCVKGFNQDSTYLIVHIFTVNLGLDNVHERVDQSRALPELPPRLTSL